MLLHRNARRLEAAEVPPPTCGVHDVLLRVDACAVCRTDLHIIDGDLVPPAYPVICGHEIVGRVIEAGAEARWKVGDRVGVPWLARTCGVCGYCRSGRENLCERAEFTGFHRAGGFAELAVADSRFSFALPESYGDVEAAPLMCAGLIGYRSLRMCGDARRIGIYGFGAAAHIITQVARHQGRRIFAFTRGGDDEAQQFAREVGCEWTGDSTSAPPEELDAAIIFAPAGELVPRALSHVARGGVVVCGGIHMSDVPSFPYELLWGERMVRSVANLTRQDAVEFLTLATEAQPKIATMRFSLDEANDAIDALRNGKIRGAAVLS